MRLLADLMLIVGAAGAAVYCMVLSQRLRRLTDLDSGLGKAIGALSAQVSEMSASIEQAKTAAKTSTSSIDRAVQQANIAARRLEVLIASLHDLPSETSLTEGQRAERPASAERSASQMGQRRAPGLSPNQERRREQVL